MAVFRSGLFTARVAGKDVEIGFNTVLKVLLAVVDREYDRQRAFRRARIIRKAMGGIDFEKSRVSLGELCFNLMQNVSLEERERFDDEIEKLAAIEMDGVAKAMSYGLKLIGIVGENTLDAATTNLGSGIASFQPLTQELQQDVLAIKPEDLIANLFVMCNALAHERSQLRPADIQRLKDEIARQGLPRRIQAILIAYLARTQYGADVLQAALKLIPNQIEEPTESAPAAPPPQAGPAPTPAPTPAPAPPASEQPEEPEEPEEPESRASRAGHSSRWLRRTSTASKCWSGRAGVS
jgi:hypothetical protein